MAKRNELKVIGIVVSEVDGQRVERYIDDLSEEERAELGVNLTDKFMSTLGYVRADGNSEQSS